MKRPRPWVIALGVLGGLAGLVFLVYGTVSPCGILLHQVRATMRDRAQTLLAGQSGLAAAGVMLGAAAMDRLAEAWVGGMGPLDCLSALGRLSDEQLVADMRRQASTPTPASATPAPTGSATAPARIHLSDRVEPAEIWWESGNLLFWEWRGETKMVLLADVRRIVGAPRPPHPQKHELRPPESCARMPATLSPALAQLERERLGCR